MTAKEALKQVTTAGLDDIQPGAVLWHVYGFKHGTLVALRLITGPVTVPVVDAHEGFGPLTKDSQPYSEEHFDPRWFVARYLDQGHLTVRSLWDCGIGANYNQNRLFTSQAEAQRYCDLLNL